MLLELIDEAVASGAPLYKACATVGLAPTTIARWRAKPGSEDGRRGPLTKPSNALSDQERAEVVSLMNDPEHSSMSPSTLVPFLATLPMGAVLIHAASATERIASASAAGR